MFVHAQRKDLSLIERDLERGASVGARDRQGYTALIHACGAAHGISPSVEVARYLLARGAEVDAQATGGFTALTEACAYGAFEVVELLLEAGADPNLKGQRGTPALMFAATCFPRANEAPRLVRLLLEAGAEVDAADEYGYTALLRLVSGSRYQPEVARLLIDAGADASYVGPYQTTVLSSAAANGYLELIELLAARGALAGNKEQGERALIAAMQKNHKEVVAFLLEAGAESADGALLAYASAYGHSDLFRFIDLTSVSQASAREALVQAARTGQLEIIKTLVEHGAGPNLDGEGEEAPLMTAARHGRLEVADYLLQHHALLEARDARGNTPLLFAAFEGQLEMLRLLLDRGADVNATNQLGWTALFQACAKGHEPCVRELIHRGADLEAVEAEQGTTPLIVAASEGHLSAVRLLLTAGANMEVHAKNGRTALTWAKGNGHTEIVDMLLQAGATLPPSPSRVGRGDSPSCAYCEAPLSEELAADNHCPSCDASYCETHYPWSDWQYEDAAADEMYRSAICPQGHRHEERGEGD